MRLLRGWVRWGVVIVVMSPLFSYDRFVNRGLFYVFSYGEERTGETAWRSGNLFWLFAAIGMKLHNSKRSFYTLSPGGHYMYRTVVTICTAQWPLYVPHSGHCMYRTVVTICTAQWSLYVPHSGHCTYRTVVTICTAQWSLYVPHSGHCMYRTAVTVCTAQRLQYVPHNGHYMYHQI